MGVAEWEWAGMGFGGVGMGGDGAWLGATGQRGMSQIPRLRI